jgi:hypothetical protein
VILLECWQLHPRDLVVSIFLCLQEHRLEIYYTIVRPQKIVYIFREVQQCTLLSKTECSEECSYALGHQDTTLDRTLKNDGAAKKGTVIVWEVTSWLQLFLNCHKVHLILLLIANL